VLEQYATPAELLAHPASQFVEDFLGEGRLVRRLALIKVRDVKLIPPNGASPPATSVDASASLRDALDAVLRADDGRVRVIDGDSVLGIVTFDAIREASR
jgi:osmoprotectant transport system ATP-binding protein